MKSFFYIILTCIFLISNITFSRDFRVNQIPNGSKYQCLNCHTSSAGGGSLNAFGTEIKNNFLTSKNASGNVIWNATLANIDSDKDGFSNGNELGDPLGTWKSGNSNPGIFANVTLPGSASSKPTDVLENSNNQISDALKVISLYPNPVINSTFLNYELKYSDFITISIYDYCGNEVKNLFNGFQVSGIQNLSFEINSSPNNTISRGSYMIVIKSGSNVIVEKLVIN